MKNNDYNFRVILLCLLKNVISLICFTILAVVFKHWWIVFFSLLFYSYTEKEKYFKETCRCCRFNCENSKGLPDDIGKPIESKVDYFPSHKGCKNFEWD